MNLILAIQIPYFWTTVLEESKFGNHDVER